ncbi:protease inhibitor I42 family protein [Aminirod propionatiphilus]|uniref:Protease inhibitor I42 family protein n=1 Tax=Aminirod propionatiphilus TaxID=3415223 RepID=A0ACD1DYH5_9BACT|nr:protease inhibitor I42 family protein [Synergistota bacterium]
MNWKVFFSILLSVLLFASCSAAEGPHIQGLVRDGCGEPLAGIRIRGWDGKRAVSALSDGRGEFVLPGLEGTSVALRWDRDGHPSARLDSVRLPSAGALFVSLEYGEMPSGGTFVVRIPTNPSTGYSWSLDGAGDGAVVRTAGVVMEEPEPERSPRGRGGAGAHQLWLFRALTKGTATLSFVYRRPWESLPPARIHVAVLTVR